MQIFQKSQTISFVLILSFAFHSVSFSQVQSFYIQPSQTDPNLSSAQDSHYLAYNTGTKKNKLLLFIGGSFSRAGNYNIFCDYAAGLGYDVISLSYPNSVAAASLGTSTDSLVFNKYRQEISFGTPLSSDVSVDTSNSIHQRIRKLLIYLQSSSSNNWGLYLNSDKSLNWSKVAIAGHSQGSGHACYLSKNFNVDRVIMLSGPNDYSTNFSRPANWLSSASATPLSKHFTLLHLNDEIVPFAHQYQNNLALGMKTMNDTVLIDKISSPFNQSNFLYNNLPAISNHNSTVGNNAKIKEVWEYFLTKSISSSIENQALNSPEFFS